MCCAYVHHNNILISSTNTTFQTFFPENALQTSAAICGLLKRKLSPSKIIWRSPIGMWRLTFKCLCLKKTIFLTDGWDTRGVQTMYESTCLICRKSIRYSCSQWSGENALVYYKAEASCTHKNKCNSLWRLPIVVYFYYYTFWAKTINKPPHIELINCIFVYVVYCNIMLTKKGNNLSATIKYTGIQNLWLWINWCFTFLGEESCILIIMCNRNN